MTTGLRMRLPDEQIDAVKCSTWRSSCPSPYGCVRDGNFSCAPIVCTRRTGRSQGARAGGQLVPANEGRFIEAALRQQWHQLAELQAALDAATGVVVLQAAQIAHLQEHAANDEQQQQLEALSPEAAKGSNLVDQPHVAVSPDRQRKAAEGGRWSPVEPGKLMGGPSPRSATATRAASPAGSMLAKRPPTSGHQGMIASLKSDLEAWRAK